MKLIKTIFCWIKGLFKKEKLPESIKIQANNSLITIIIHRD